MSTPASRWRDHPALRARLGRLEPAFRTEVAFFLNAAEQSLNYRNAVVHSLWVSSEAADSRGWRNIRKSGRDKDKPEEWAQWADTTHEELADRLLRAILLIHDVNNLQVLVASKRVDSKPL